MTMKWPPVFLVESIWSKRSSSSQTNAPSEKSKRKKTADDELTESDSELHSSDMPESYLSLSSHKPNETKNPPKTIKEKYIKKINAVVDNYPEAVSTEDRITGRFK